MNLFSNKYSPANDIQASVQKEAEVASTSTLIEVSRQKSILQVVLHPSLQRDWQVVLYMGHGDSGGHGI